MRYTGTITDAGTHARQAMYGTIDEGPVDGLHGGVFIAFRYEEREHADWVGDLGDDDVPPRRTVGDALGSLRRRIGRIRLPVVRGRR